MKAKTLVVALLLPLVHAAGAHAQTCRTPIVIGPNGPSSLPNTTETVTDDVAVGPRVPNGDQGPDKAFVTYYHPFGKTTTIVDGDGSVSIDEQPATVFEPCCDCTD